MKPALLLKPVRAAVFAGMIAVTGLSASAGRTTAPPEHPAGPIAVEYRGLCDASAAAFIGDSLMVVANDEDNTLLIYRLGEPDPVRSIPLDAFLRPDAGSKNTEADIEAAASLDNLVFWITSHGRDKDGDRRLNRHRFFALRKDPLHPDRPAPVGTAYERLVFDLLADPGLSGLGLQEAASPSIPRKKSLAPKKKGLNIEGLCRVPGTRSLWIGFRNPAPGGKALLVPFLNPEEVVMKGSPCRFGKPVLLDLGGLSIRDMVAIEATGTIWIIAGRTDGTPDFQIFTWTGRPGDAPVQDDAGLEWTAAESFTPEAILAEPGGRSAILLSDDGERAMRGTDGIACPCKKLKNAADRRFRAARLSPFGSPSGGKP
ncbi:MAG: DUF3616 domain-containing protein [bacterium]|nr:DUF3616 domain-containing protein [bacterium]